MHHHLMKYLTLFGATPFVICTLAIALEWGEIRFLSPYITTDWNTLLLTYTAIILSFLGGVHWGFALSENDSSCSMRRVIMSNIVSLSAWLGLLIHQPWIALLFMAALYITLWISDVALAKRGIFPDWFGILRFRISCVVVPCLIISSYLLF